MSLPELVLPDFSAPLDVEAAIAAAPEDGFVKGMFFATLHDALNAAGQRIPDQRDRYTAFKNYPLREYMRFVVDAAEALHPDVPVREALRRVGWTSFPTFVESLIGRVLMGVLGRDMVSVTKAAGKAYAQTGHPGEAEVIEVSDRHSLVHLTNVHTFIDCLQVGVFEGCLKALDHDGEVRVGMTSTVDGYIGTQFSPRP